MDENEAVKQEIILRRSRERAEDNESVRRANEAAQAAAEAAANAEPEVPEPEPVIERPKTANDLERDRIIARRSQEVALEVDGYTRSGEMLNALDDFKVSHSDVVQSEAQLAIVAEMDHLLAMSNTTMPEKERLEIIGDIMRGYAQRREDFDDGIAEFNPEVVAATMLRHRQPSEFEKTKSAIQLMKEARGQRI